AGPVGLFAALSLAKLGVRVEVVDRQWRTGAHSYALALHGQSLQMLGELGLSDSIVERAYRVGSVGLYDASGRRAEMRISELGGPFPFVAVMPQDQLERVLERALEEQGVKVRWNHEVARLDQDDRGVSATIHRLEKQSTGYAIAHTEWVVADTAQINVPLVIGADGHRSTVRRSLVSAFDEVRPAQYFAVFEFRTDADLSGEMRVVMTDRATDVVWPLPDGACRWSFQLSDYAAPAATREKQRVVLQQIGGAEFPVVAEQRLRGLLAQRGRWFGGTIDEITWQIAVRFEHRLAERFGSGRLWLAGDAGHTTGPVGMQSMNVGFREAQELAAIFASILRGKESIGALESYGRGRREEWRYLLGLDGGLKPTGAGDPWVARQADRLTTCIPASRDAYARLAGQLGLEASGGGHPAGS
ncbi:MAG: FAD-dependent monooxygenase, partial [Pirellulales bacterium]|nr:FAD-dependent monooxygenase [Pirellulales bacterium]